MRYRIWLVPALVTGVGLGLLSSHTRATLSALMKGGGSRNSSAVGVQSPGVLNRGLVAVSVSDSSVPAAAARSSTSATPKNGSVDSGKTSAGSVPQTPAFMPPEGTMLVSHVVMRNESLGGIVSHYFSDSVYMRRSEFEDALRQVNVLKANYLHPGTEIKIPGIPVHPILDKPVPTPKDFVARGIYLTAYFARQQHRA